MAYNGGRPSVRDTLYISMQLYKYYDHWSADPVGLTSIHKVRAESDACLTRTVAFRWYPMWIVD